jgi:hypothetical protein
MKNLNVTMSIITLVLGVSLITLIVINIVTSGIKDGASFEF